ncbi:MAG: transglutaminase family protein [Opitutaceae bacterium]|nr:transglutaminase family protein [Opitutaceae bacterium]
MRFRISHRTRYRYAGAASESFMEARLTPANDAHQRLNARSFSTQPACNIHTYADYFGNQVETFSIVQRHEELLLESISDVETMPCAPPDHALAVSISEAAQIYRAEKLGLFEFLMPSPAIALSAEINALANEMLKARDPLGPALLRLNAWIKETFRYQPGATRVDTTSVELLKLRAGVCQDFAQLMIAILRSAEIPARYVTGYIETESQRRASETNGSPRLIGASESHAWVEVYLPGGYWWPLDPTNNCVAEERHVRVAMGRDYLDCSPTRGVFKGTHTENLSVAVVMQRV